MNLRRVHTPLGFIASALDQCKPHAMIEGLQTPRIYGVPSRPMYTPRDES